MSIWIRRFVKYDNIFKMNIIYLFLINIKKKLSIKKILKISLIYLLLSHIIIINGPASYVTTHY